MTPREMIDKPKPQTDPQKPDGEQVNTKTEACVIIDEGDISKLLYPFQISCVTWAIKYKYVGSPTPSPNDIVGD